MMRASADVRRQTHASMPRASDVASFFPKAGFHLWSCCLADAIGQLIFAHEIGKARELGRELKRDGGGWPMALLADDDIGLAVNGFQLGLPLEMLLGAGARL